MNSDLAIIRSCTNGIGIGGRGDKVFESGDPFVCDLSCPDMRGIGMENAAE
jgi:hypothetical protein